jgi:hypothetical protein
MPFTRLRHMSQFICICTQLITDFHLSSPWLALKNEKKVKLELLILFYLNYMTRLKAAERLYAIYFIPSLYKYYVNFCHILYLPYCFGRKQRYSFFIANKKVFGKYIFFCKKSKSRERIIYYYTDGTVKVKM